MTIANWLTFFRILCVPLIFVAFYGLPNGQAIAVGIFVLAGASDFFDGYIARHFEQGSELGAFLDPVADKLMVASCLLLLTESYASLWILLPSAIIIAREIYVSAIREWMAGKSLSNLVQVTFIAKCKTTAQMTAIVCLLYAAPSWDGFFANVGVLMLYIAALLTAWTGLEYWLKAKPYLFDASSK